MFISAAINFGPNGIAARAIKSGEVDLIIAYEIIKAHGGEIEAQARDDGGMIFKIRLPV